MWPTGRAWWLLPVALYALAWGVNRAARRVRGGSMRPTLDDGDVVLTLPARRLRRGDVVVVRDPRDPRRRTIKRIAATAGATADLPDGPAPVPAGHVAVEGDAPAASTDSRVFGAVPLELVERRVLIRVWPRPARC